KAVESLTRVGAMDCLDGHRAQLAEAVDIAIQYGQKAQANAAAGMISLFGEAGGDGAAGLEPSLPTAEPWPKSRLLKEERESVGFYVTGHPLEAYTAENRAFASAQITDAAAIIEREGPVDDSWAGRQNRPQHTFCGIITSVQHRMTKGGKPWASAQFEDFSGQAELVCFSNTYDRVQNYLNVDEIVLIKGPVEMRGGMAKVMANDVIPMWKVREQLVKSLSIRIQAAELNLSHVDELETLLSEHRGTCKLYFDLVDEERPQPTRILCRSFVVDPNTEVMQGIEKIFGRRSIVVEGD
ncbi:MAG: OB-fold nucleic acid binding domain-containing protein, partial [Bacteroidetes bacterium]|nr:OB-fold nucleic acid binding domain-containing protein [Bacteroidota bacterium]